ncbi:hypothetical protein CYMTET_54119 [Cymbomonas tetramitiformis]|uniref:Transmembrane protein n=1 Tax=Cymbomonas tetramitiformis TaxID=36881 RepID=A0AAE0BHE9_9CHLO|nr:hypothetical protein CYMTET_54119 [Cymbomonas tetramitiformis]|eukprot:gene19900-23807_t
MRVSVRVVADIPVVVSDIQFYELEMSSFDNATFAASFREEFRSSMAASAQVSVEAVTIIEIKSGSVVVSSEVACSSEEAAGAFSLQLTEEVGTVFSDPYFDDFGDVESENVATLVYYSPSPPPSSIGEVSSPDDGDATSSASAMPGIIGGMAAGFILLAAAALFVKHRRRLQSKGVSEEPTKETQMSSKADAEVDKKYTKMGNPLFAETEENERRQSLSSLTINPIASSEEQGAAAVPGASEAFLEEFSTDAGMEPTRRASGATRESRAPSEGRFRLAHGSQEAITQAFAKVHNRPRGKSVEQERLRATSTVSDDGSLVSIVPNPVLRKHSGSSLSAVPVGTGAVAAGVTTNPLHASQTVLVNEDLDREIQESLVTPKPEAPRPVVSRKEGRLSRLNLSSVASPAPTQRDSAFSTDNPLVPQQEDVTEAAFSTGNPLVAEQDVTEAAFSTDNPLIAQQKEAAAKSARKEKRKTVSRLVNIRDIIKGHENEIRHRNSDVDLN